MTTRRRSWFDEPYRRRFHSAASGEVRATARGRSGRGSGAALAIWERWPDVLGDTDGYSRRVLAVLRYVGS